MSNSNENTIIKVPTHVAIIPDGNRRWAKENGLPTLEGHRKGAENSEDLINAARDLGIKYFSGWSFSTENWQRAQEENKYLFNLLREFVKRYKKKFLAEKIRFFHLGRKDRIPQDLVDTLLEIEDATKTYKDFTVCMAMDYGGHDEVLRAIKKAVKDIQDGKISVEDLQEEIGLYSGKVPLYKFQNYLDTGIEVPPPDLIIRTSGEQRLSGFMTWQSAYAEYMFPKLYFPDFSPEKLKEAVEQFSNRDRRFGGDSSISRGDYSK